MLYTSIFTSKSNKILLINVAVSHIEALFKRTKIIAETDDIMIYTQNGDISLIILLYMESGIFKTF